MAREIICGIYKITNLVNGKIYIGQSQDIYRRWQEHKKNFKYKKYSSIILYKAFKKYGIDNFRFEIIEICEKEQLEEREKFNIKYFNSFIGFKNSNGYNMTLGGEGQIGVEWTEDRKRRLSQSLKGRPSWNKGLRYENFKLKRKFTKEGNPFYGKKHSKESIEKMRASAKGRKANNRTQVICDNKIFDSITECANFYDVDYRTMSDWLLGRRGAPKYFIEKGLETVPASNKIRIAHKATKEKNGSAKKVICITTNKIYATITEACNDTGANINTIIKVCNGKGKSAGKLKDGTKLVWMYYEEYLKGGENGCEKK